MAIAFRGQMQYILRPAGGDNTSLFLPSQSILQSMLSIRYFSVMFRLDHSVLFPSFCLNDEEFEAHSCNRCNICLQRFHCYSLIVDSMKTIHMIPVSCVWKVQTEFKVGAHWCAFESLNDHQGKQINNLTNRIIYWLIKLWAFVSTD